MDEIKTKKTEILSVLTSDKLYILMYTIKSITKNN